MDISNCIKHVRFKQIFSLILIFVLILLCRPESADAALADKLPSINVEKIEMVVGDSVQLYTQNTGKGLKISWNSEDKKIVTVNQKGMVTAKKAGETEIKAVIRSGLESVTVSCKIKVNSNVGNIKQKVVFKTEVISGTEEKDGLASWRYLLNIPKLTIKGNSKATKKINRIFTNIKKNELAEIEKQQDETIDSGRLPMLLYRELETSFPYHNGYLLSYLSRTDISTSGAHPYYSFACMVFDLSKGKQVKLSDIFTDVGKARERIREDILSYINEYEADAYYNLNYEKKLLSGWGNKHWYIDKDRFVIVFSPDEIAPYAAGQKSYEIELDRLKEFMTPYGAELLFP